MAYKIEIPFRSGERLGMLRGLINYRKLISSLIDYFESHQESKYELIYEFINGVPAPTDRTTKKINHLLGYISMSRVKSVYDSDPKLIAKMAIYRHYYGKHLNKGREVLLITSDDLRSLEIEIEEIYNNNKKYE